MIPADVAMTTCTSCGAPIFFGLTKNSKSIPVDAEPVADGNLYFVPANDEGGGVAVLGGAPSIAVVGKKNPVPEHAQPERFVSHFTTCPNATFHRRRT